MARFDKEAAARAIETRIDQLRSINPREPGTWPAPIRIMALAIVFAATVVGGHLLIWSGQLDSIDKAERKESTLREEWRDKQAQALNLDAYKAQLGEIDQQFGVVLKQLPNRAEMDTLLKEVNVLAASLGLRVDLFQPSAEIMRDFYAEVPIKVTLAGSYHDMGDFTAYLSRLQRMVLLRDMTIAPGKDGVLTLDGQAAAYRYLDDQEMSELSASKAKEKSAKKGTRKGGK